MTRLSIDEQLREAERADREAREARSKPKSYSATHDLFRIQLCGLITIAETDNIRSKLIDALNLHDSLHPVYG